jgi:hypothetical protein
MAIVSYDMAIKLNPTYATAYSNRGTALQALNKLSAAIESFNLAIQIQPDYSDAYYNLGNAYKELGKFNTAVSSFNKSINLNPNFAQAHSNLGNSLKELKQVEQALASYDRALALNTSLPEIFWNKSLCLLLNGSLSQAWPLYEYRWDQKDTIKFKRNFSQPLWLGGESLAGKTILLHAEQGLGDTIQFCRYVQMVAALGATVILEVQKPLLPLLANLPGISRLISRGDELPAFDFHCPLLSLPLAFKTDLKSIPNAPCYLQADPKRVSHWRQRINSERFKIGVSWQGSNLPSAAGRSFELKHLEEISKLPNVQLISLQKGYGSEQLKEMPQGMQVLELGDELDADAAFLDTAAVMQCMDLVISCDTATAHLAGALGVQTWVALKYVPDWRWMLDRTDSPWYPRIKLYRQESIDDWTPVFNRMKIDINFLLHKS